MICVVMFDFVSWSMVCYCVRYSIVLYMMYYHHYNACYVTGFHDVMWWHQRAYIYSAGGIYALWWHKMCYSDVS